ncbi:MAG: PaaI family thioesterase [Alphaproteobacteria bacterium]
MEDLIAQAQAPDGFAHVNLGNGFASHVGPLFMKAEDPVPIIGFRVLEHHCNPADICHGGMMMTVMDMAIGMGAASKVQTAQFTPSVNLTYDFMRPAPKGIWLQSRIDFAEGRKRIAFAHGYLDGPDGPVIRCNGITKIPSAGSTQFKIRDGEPWGEHG